MIQEPLRLLLLDRHPGWVEPLLPAFQAAGLEARLCHRVDEARAVLEQGQADLIVVGLNGGSASGASLANWLHGHPPAPPLLAVGSPMEERLRVQLLESWADDVLPLPLALPEFAARCRALWRRARLRQQLMEPHESLTQLSWGPVSMCVEEHRVTCGGEPVELTPREFRLLEHLLRHPGQVFDRDTLLEHVWGEFCSLELDPKTVDVHIRWLRLKLETDPSAPMLITTVRGRGYRLG